MGGGSKSDMKKAADEHYAALQQIIPGIKRIMLFDRDDSEKEFHPTEDNPALFEWKRRNIENYLLVPSAWHRASMGGSGDDAPDLFTTPIIQIIDRFFTDQNLTLPAGRTWRDVSANIFTVVDGKKILFENDDSLFQLLRQESQAGAPIRENIAARMREDELHDDVHDFMRKLASLVP